MYNRKINDPYHLDNFSLRFLYQIFYQFNKFDNIEDVLQLESYMYNKEAPENLQNLFGSHGIIIDDSVAKEPVSIEIQEEEVSNNLVKEVSHSTMKYFSPRQSDTLFWCIFHEIFGENEYLQIGGRYANRETDEKQKIIQYFRSKDVKMLKNSNQKITNGEAQEIMSEFMCIQNKTSLMGLIGLVVYYKRVVYLVHNSKNIFMKFGHVDNELDEPIIIEYEYNDNHRQKSKYKLCLINSESEKQDYITKLQKTKLELHQYNKPLMGLSSYKIDDLREI